MLLFLLVVAALTWMHLSVRHMEREKDVIVKEPRTRVSTAYRIEDPANASAVGGSPG